MSERKKANSVSKAYSVSNVISTNQKVFDFTGEWEEAFNKPAKKGKWFIWGESGNAKSEFVMMLVKYLMQFEKGLYNSLEEGTSKSFRDRLLRLKMATVNRKLKIVSEPYEEFIKRLDKQRCPKIIVIDSIQYFKMVKSQLDYFDKTCANKTVIIVSHAKNGMPKGALAEAMMYDAYIKIFVAGYKAISKGREFGVNGGVFDIWQEGVNKYWGENEVKPE